MKITTTTDPRTEPLPLVIDDQGLARRVQDAPTAAEAWERLGLPGGRADVDPAAVAALADAATALCTTSDAIGLGLRHFGELPADADPPPAWVERMAELHVQELEGYWVLDDLASAGLEEGGWTVTTGATDPDPAKRIAQRARWQAMPLRPREPALWFDRLLRVLDAATDPEHAREAGRLLVRGAAHKHFSDWRNTRRNA